MNNGRPETPRQKQLKFLEFLGTIGGLLSIAIVFHSTSDVTYGFVVTCLLVFFFLSVIYLYSRVLFEFGSSTFLKVGRFTLTGSLAGLLVVILYSVSSEALKSPVWQVVLVAAIVLILSVFIWFPLARFFESSLPAQGEPPN